MSTPDNNYLSVADCTDKFYSGVTIDPRLEGIDPATIDDVWKFSNVQRARAEYCTVATGGTQQENALDCNRGCTVLTYDHCRFEQGLQNALTVKGGCRRITFIGCEIVPGSGHCDIELGNWSDQSQAKVTDISLINCRRTDFKPIRLRVGHAIHPYIEATDTDYQWFQSLLLKAYWWLRFLVRKLTGK